MTPRLGVFKGRSPDSADILKGNLNRWTTSVISSENLELELSRIVLGSGRVPVALLLELACRLLARGRLQYISAMM